MNCYELSTPRTALGLVAGALTAITFGVMVVLPATFESAGTELSGSALAESEAVRSVGFVIGSVRLEVPEGAYHETRDGASCAGGGRAPCAEPAAP